MGPASKNQFHDVSEGYHCKKCGLKYRFVPSKNILKQENKELSKLTRKLDEYRKNLRKLEKELHS